jgi:hypothetical protein
MDDNEGNWAAPGRKWIGDISAERVGEIWRAEDHEALLTTLRNADQVTAGLVALARREASEASKVPEGDPISAEPNGRRNL